MSLQKTPVISITAAVVANPGREYSIRCPPPPPETPNTAASSSGGYSSGGCYYTPIYGAFTPEQQRENGGVSYGVVGYQTVCTQ